jgi:flagellar FliL protein
MSDSENQDVEVEQKRSKMPLILSVLFALIGAGAGFAAVSMGVLPIGKSPQEEHEGGNHAVEKASLDAASVAYVALPPLMVSFHEPTQAQQLRFLAQLEVNSVDKDNVAQLAPRITDMMNGYLRALTLEELKDPLALIRIRSHLQSRIDILVGQNAVRDVLIMEFVLN